MPELGVRSEFGLQIMDNSGETKSILVNGFEIVPLTLTDDLELFGDFQAAIQAVIFGRMRKVSWGQAEVLSNTPAASKQAQVESEMLVRLLTNATQKPLSFRIPTVDYTKFNYASPPAADHVVLSGAGATAETLALVAAIEALVTNPDDVDDGVTVIDIVVAK